MFLGLLFTNGQLKTTDLNQHGSHVLEHSPKLGMPGAEDQKTTGRTHLEKVNSADTVFVLDPAMDKRITRKFDRHIVPWLFGLWLLAFIDRSNIGM